MRSVACALALAVCGAAAALCQTPTLTDIQNIAGNASNGAIAPGSLVSIFGSNLASSMAISDSVPLSSTVGGVSVTIGGYAAPIQSVGPNQITVQAPWETPTSDMAGPQAVVVTVNGTASAALNANVLESAPGIYNIGGQAVAMNSDGTMAAPANSIPGINTRPATIGDPNGLVILATGMGAVSASIVDGANSSDMTRNTVATPTVTIGGMPAQVTFSGLSVQYVGMNQINVMIPPGTPTGGAVTVQISVSGPNGSTITSNIATIAVSN